MNDSMNTSIVTPLKVRLQEGTAAGSVLDSMDEDTHQRLCDFLVNRLKAGNQNHRSERLMRCARIDQLISTWQKLKPEDAERERTEDVTGRNQAIPINIPLLATHLDDMTSYYAEVFSPIGGNFYTSEASEAAVKTLKVMNRDAAARDHYGEIALTMRSMLKYNIGGFAVEWEPEGTVGSMTRQKGNRWKALDMYNTLWDPAITDPKMLATQGEWGAYVELKNRLWLLRKSMSGAYARVGKVIENQDEMYRIPATAANGKKASFYRHPPASAGLPSDGSDSKSTHSETNGSGVDWRAYGLETGTGTVGIPVDTYEQVTMYCWINPVEYGLLPEAEVQQLEELGIRKDSFIELWKFVVIDGAQVVMAEPLTPRDRALVNAEAQARGAAAIAGGNLPMHLALMTQDQIQQAQRSYMELMRGFQRLGSYLINIYIAGLRKNIWGIKGYDPTMFDISDANAGDVAAWFPSKIAGRDVRSGIMQLDSNAGVDQAMDALARTLDLSNQLFPTQQLPSQVASIDRAVKSQVTAVMQGAQKRLRMTVRIIDSSLLTPARMTTYQNLVTFAKGDIDAQLTDEDMSKIVGSGVESIEAERIVEVLRDLMFAIIQNQESMQTFDVPGLMSYMSKLMHLGVDLGDFVKQVQPQAGTGGAAAGGDPSQAQQPGHVAGAGAPGAAQQA